MQPADDAELIDTTDLEVDDVVGADRGTDPRALARDVLTVPELAWALGRVYMGWPTRLVTRVARLRPRADPATGGLVYAINHLHWIDVPLVGVVSPRNIDFVAKAEARAAPRARRVHPLARHDRGAPRRVRPRRGAPDARRSARDGRVVGLFVEGTRRRTGRPGTAQPGAAMVAIQEDVPVVPVAIYGTQFWKVGNFAPARSRSASRCASTGCRRAARATRRRPPRSSAASTCSSTGSPSVHAQRAAAGMRRRRCERADEPPERAARHGRDRRLPERRQVDADQPAHVDARRRSCTRRRARRATARS